MPVAFVNWTFSGTGVANADGSLAAVVQGATEVPGPGDGEFGNLSTALSFGAGASCRVQVSPGSFDATRFAVRIIFRVAAPVTARGNLVEATALPFALFVEPGNAADRFNLVASVGNGAAGWTSAHSSNRRTLSVGQWHVADLVYDIDTLALMVNGTVIAVAAFPRGGLQAPGGDMLHVGTWVDGARWPFGGEVAGLQVWNDIPEALEAKLDAERGSPEWHLSRKDSEVRPTMNLGPKTADFYLDPGTNTYIQPYALAVISYTEAHGAAFVMYGLILAKWRADEALRRSLGGLASDEIPSRRSGGRKSVFAQGCLYWSPATGAVPVLGRMYLDFELIGEGASAIGLPMAEAAGINGGKMQRFQSGKMYLRNGASNAFEVHGAILGKYEAAGGPDRFGFPVSHESDVLRGTVVAGKFSEFERCTIWWSPATPASIVYGAIRNRYRGVAGGTGEGGPLGDLGFPTTDESDIPGAPGGRYNGFQNGSILWFGGPIEVCRPFTVALGRLDTQEEDRDIFDLDGQNDLYCRVCVDVNGGRVFDRKFPESQTHYASANVRDLNINVPYTITPNGANVTARVRVEVWESDDGNLFGGGDDHLGTMTSDLNMANAWGMRNGTNGLFSATNFGPWVNRLDWSVKPRVVPGTPRDFWGVTNAGTAVVSRREYAQAFSDVDPDFEVDFGIIDAGLDELYYELVVKGVAAGGNCFGMSLEAIDAWKGRSRLGAPLRRFSTWGQVEDDFNVKHTYQAGADAIWWFVGQFLSGSTHDPMGVFQATWDAFNRGEDPVVCIAQNYDFSGGPHCIVPISWNRNVTPWEIGIFDPNFQNSIQKLFVDPRDNTFSYAGAGRNYGGGAWSGGRFHYMPWSVLNHRQRTPIWDAILLLLSGVVVLFGDATDVVDLTDEKGDSLLASSVTSRDFLKGKLLGIPGISGDGPVLGGFYVGRQEPKPMFLNPVLVDILVQPALATLAAQPAATQPQLGVGTALGAGMASTMAPRPASIAVRPGGLRPSLSVQPAIRIPVASDAPANAISGAGVLDLGRIGGIEALRPPRPTDLDTIRSSLRGKRDGRLKGYVKRGLFGIGLEGDVATGENVSVHCDRMTSRENEVSVQSDRSRRYTLRFAQKLGAGSDYVKVVMSGLPVDAGKRTVVNVQPGMAAVDLLSTGAPAEVRLEIDGVIAGEAVRSAFNIEVRDGQRIVLPELSDPGRLRVGRIERLLGPATGMTTILRQ